MKFILNLPPKKRVIKKSWQLKIPVDDVTVAYTGISQVKHHTFSVKLHT